MKQVSDCDEFYNSIVATHIPHTHHALGIQGAFDKVARSIGAHMQTVQGNEEVRKGK